MSCPLSVPTYGFETCGQSIMFTADGSSSTPAVMYGMGGRKVRLHGDTGTLSIMILDNMTMQETRKFLDKNQTFAVYINHLGRIAWHVVRHSGASTEWKKDGKQWKGTLQVEVIGYTYTATPMTPPDRVVDDAGNYLVDDAGNYLYTDLTPGQATGCINL